MKNKQTQNNYESIDLYRSLFIELENKSHVKHAYKLVRWDGSISRKSPWVIIIFNKVIIGLEISDATISLKAFGRTYKRYI